MRPSSDRFAGVEGIESAPRSRSIVGEGYLAPGIINPRLGQPLSRISLISDASPELNLPRSPAASGTSISLSNENIWGHSKWRQR